MAQAKNPNECNSQRAEDSFSQTYEAFLPIVRDLSQKFKRTETSVIKSLIENICEYRARYEIENSNHYSIQRFDRYFSLKHEFIKNKFAQRLSVALRSQGIKACIATEKKSHVGVFDVTIQNKGHIISITDNKVRKNIIVELKGGNSFDLYQIERYLWECDVLVLVRIALNQVVRIERNEVEKYLITSLLDLKERASMISTGKDPQKIPGSYCRGCPVTQCEYYKPVQNEALVAYDSESMKRDMITIFSNVHNCIDSAILVIIRELCANESDLASKKVNNFGGETHSGR